MSTNYRHALLLKSSRHNNLFKLQIEFSLIFINKAIEVSTLLYIKTEMSGWEYPVKIHYINTNFLKHANSITVNIQLK